MKIDNIFYYVLFLFFIVFFYVLCVLCFVNWKLGEFFKLIFEKRGGRIVERFFDEDIIFLMVVGLYCLMFFNYYIYNNVNVNFCVRCVFGGIILSFCGIGIS